MITHIGIDGFRSFSKFKMDLKPGLNILVGPNGAGKTNVILFFEFLSALFSERLSEAVNKCGGVGSIFKKHSSTGHFVDEIQISIRGNTTSPYQKSNFRYVKYEYNFTVAFSDERDLVYFKKQEVKLSSSEFALGPKTKWDLIVVSEILDVEKLEVRTKIVKIDFRKTESNSPLFSLRGGTRHQKILSLERHFDRSFNPELPLMRGIQRIMSESKDVLFDFFGGQSLNVVPSIAKRHEDSATPPGIRRDGSGLAATLYSLIKRDRILGAGRISRFSRYQGIRYSTANRAQDNFFYSSNAFAKIKEYVNLVNSEIVDVAVSKDHDDNQLKISMILKTENGRLRLPFSFMSDGTVKWVALVTAIFTNNSMFAIEEPENFIHPLMQQEILKLMREVSESRRMNMFVLLTTHSETLLNAASPGEIAVVTMKNGSTIVRRPKNTKLIREEINRSGFGLGYMYLSGVLDDA